MAQTGRAAWGRAVARFQHAERLESAWVRARAALDLFGLGGRPSDRTRAGADIGAGLKDQVSPDWAKVRNSLKDRRALAFLERMHRRLASAEPWREAMALRGWLRHRRPTVPDPLTGPVRESVRDRELGQAERASYDRVVAVLKDTFRASSAVECTNSVLRMQQSDLLERTPVPLGPAEGCQT